jgi:hypothetical protein
MLICDHAYRGRTWVGLGWLKRVVGVVHGLGLARQLSGVGDAKFKVHVKQGSIKV